MNEMTTTTTENNIKDRTGLSLEEMHAHLRDAFRAEYPDLTWDNSASDSHSACAMQWLSDGYWPEPVSADDVAEEYMTATRENLGFLPRQIDARAWESQGIIQPTGYTMESEDEWHEMGREFDVERVQTGLQGWGFYHHVERVMDADGARSYYLTF